MRQKLKTKLSSNTNATLKTERILAIDPGTKIIGYADFEGQNLLDFGLKSFSAYLQIDENLDAIGKAIERLMIEKRPDVIILEKNRFSQITNNLHLMIAIARIKTSAKRRGIRVIEYSPNTVRAVICKDGNATKLELAKAIVSQYPELRLFIINKPNSMLKAFFNITDAIACGRTYLDLTSKTK